MTTLTETLHDGGFVVSEANGNRSRENVTIALSQTLKAGQVVGATVVVAGATSSAAAAAGNTGNGTLTLDATAPVAAGAKNGVYRAVCIEPVAAGGIFAVEDPNGAIIGNVAVGATFNNQIKFVIADGAVDFVAGDAFAITVGIELADKNYKALDTAATTGEQVADGIMFHDVTTDGSTKKPATIIARDAEVRDADLKWPTGITAALKAQGKAELAALGIVVR